MTEGELLLIIPPPYSIDNSADWSKAELVTVSMGESDITVDGRPMVLVTRTGSCVGDRFRAIHTRNAIRVSDICNARQRGVL